jgi:hypothetical protein
MAFQKAIRKQIALKIALIGPSGAGKTYSALRLCKGLGGKTAFLDTENGRGKFYANEFDYDYDVIEAPFNPEKYITKIQEAIDSGYENVIIDSASHEWMGKGGVLDIVSNMTGNDFTRWKEPTRRHTNFVEALVQSPINLIVCLRGKDEYVLEENDKGKKVPKKIGMGAQMRDGLEYEMAVAFLIDQSNHVATAVKDNTHIFDGTDGSRLFDVLTEKHAQKLIEWANSGEKTKEKEVQKAKKEISKEEDTKALLDKIIERINSCQTYAEIKPIVIDAKKLFEEKEVDTVRDVANKKMRDLQKPKDGIETKISPRPEPEDVPLPNGGYLEG